MTRRVINTREAADHVWGNQRVERAVIIVHRSVIGLEVHHSVLRLNRETLDRLTG